MKSGKEYMKNMKKISKGIEIMYKYQMKILQLTYDLESILTFWKWIMSYVIYPMNEMKDAVNIINIRIGGQKNKWVRG